MKQTSAVVVVLVAATVGLLVAGACGAQDRRPDPAKRKFVSKAIDATIDRVASQIHDPDLEFIFRNCFPNTLDTTVASYSPRKDAFVITGDIDAMWLRDSANQLLSYVPFAKDDSALRDLLAGVVLRHARSVLIDPFANAFNYDSNGHGWQGDHRKPPMTKPVFEGKYELDSLANVMRFAGAYWKATNDTSVFRDSVWQNAMVTIVDTIRAMQASSIEMLPNTPYSFQRTTSTATDTLMLNGMGAPGARCGLSRSPFRPSDDATTLPYLVPSNAFAVAALRDIAVVWRDAVGNNAKAADAEALASEIEAALHRNAIIQTADGPVWAYEVDCFGNALFMDDSNAPSLLGLPLTGFCDISDPVYQRTRKAVLSTRNPYFFQGSAGSGIGGPHVGLNFVWPMSHIVRALTSTDDAEIKQCLQWLKASALVGAKSVPGQGYGFMHESYNVNDANRFTRPWFAWANALFGDLILKLAAERPYLL